MIAIRIFTPSLLALALVSCASHQAREYDTPTAPVSPATVSQVAPSAGAPANPVYDTPAAYEENAAAAASSRVAAPVPAAPAVSAPVAPPSNGAAIIHTVVKGDTLSGLSKQYKIPVASIKQANRMTNDTVVLGRKIVIPPQ